MLEEGIADPNNKTIREKYYKSSKKQSAHTDEKAESKTQDDAAEDDQGTVVEKHVIVRE